MLVVCFFSLVRYLTRSWPLAVLGALFLLTTQGVWIYASQVEPYAPMIGSVVVWTAALMLLRRRVSIVPWAALVALLLAVCIFYHQACVLLSIPIAAYLVAGEGKRGAVLAVGIVGFAGVVGLSAYLAVVVLTTGELP